MVYISAVDISQTKVNHITEHLVNRGRKYIKDLYKERVNSTNLVFTNPAYLQEGLFSGLAHGIKPLSPENILSNMSVLHA